VWCSPERSFLAFLTLTTSAARYVLLTRNSLHNFHEFRPFVRQFISAMTILVWRRNCVGSGTGWGFENSELSRAHFAVSISMDRLWSLHQLVRSESLTRARSSSLKTLLEWWVCCQRFVVVLCGCWLRFENRKLKLQRKGVWCV
jgi:hypothetical protein